MRSLFLLTALCMAAAVPAAAQAPERTTIVVAPIGSADMAELYYGVQQRLFERAGLDVTITPATSGATSIVAVLGNAAQIGFANTFALVTGHAKGIPFVVIAPGAQYRSALPNTKLLVAADAPLRAPGDLADRIVAVTGVHDFSTIAVDLWLEKNGVDPGRVKFVEMPPGTMLPALQAKRVDAAVLYEPFLSSAVGSGIARPLGAPYDALGDGFVTGAWFSLAPWAGAHRAAVIRFAQILSQTSQYVEEHYVELTPLIASISKLPPETLRTMVRDNVPPRMRPPALQPVIDAAAKTHELSAPFRAEEMIFPGVP